MCELFPHLELQFTQPIGCFGGGRDTAHIDNLELPQVLDAVEGAVAAGQEVVQVLLQAQRVQPG